MTTLIADIEGDGLFPSEIFCLGLKDHGQDNGQIYSDYAGYSSLREGITRLLKADKIVMHNGMSFDVPHLERLCDIQIDRTKVVDTLLMSRLNDSSKRSHSLAAWGEDLGFPKGDHNDFSQMSDEMAQYCLNDLCLNDAVFDALKPVPENVFDLETKFASVISRQEQHGFRLDIPKAVDLAAELRQEIVDIQEELQARWEPKVIERHSEKTGKRLKDRVEIFNPGSRKQIAERLNETYGWKPRRFTNAGSPKVDETVLDGLKYPEAKKLARYFRLQKMLGQLSDGENAWLKVERNGYVHGSVNTIGTSTHRCSHYAPNVAQTDKRDLRMREVWIPDPGQVLVGADANALELVCLAHYLSKFDKGEYQNTLVYGKESEGTDVHSRTQRLLELPTRLSAKIATYAYNYGAGDRKLSQISREAGGKIKDGKEIRRRMNEGITGLGELSKRIQKRADVGWFTAIDGRRIATPKPHACLNYLLQSCGAIVMKKALVVFHYDLATEAGFVRDDCPVKFSYVANVHDEIQLTADPDIAEELGKMLCRSLTVAAERLNMRCPLKGTHAIGNNWAETH